jgi:HSP20 family protein
MEECIMLPGLYNRTYWPNLLDDIFGEETPSNFGARNAYTPSVNVIEADDEYKIEMAAPGLDKDDFSINVDNHTLTISSEKELKDEEKEGRYVRREFGYNKFQRSFGLPEGVNPDDIKAKHQDGILRVHVPKTEKAKEKAPKTIEIS